MSLLYSGQPSAFIVGMTQKKTIKFGLQYFSLNHKLLIKT